MKSEICSVLDMSQLTIMQQSPNMQVYMSKWTQENQKAAWIGIFESDQISGSTRTPTVPMELHSEQLDFQHLLASIDHSTLNSFEDSIRDNFKAVQIESTIEQIKANVADFPLEVENFLRNNDLLIPFLSQMISNMRDQFFISGGLLTEFVLRKYSDIEVAEIEDIEIIVKIAVKDSNVLLKLWETADKQIYQELPREVSRKLVVSFEQL